MVEIVIVRSDSSEDAAAAARNLVSWPPQRLLVSESEVGAWADAMASCMASAKPEPRSSPTRGRRAASSS